MRLVCIALVAWIALAIVSLGGCSSSVSTSSSTDAGGASGFITSGNPTGPDLDASAAADGATAPCAPVSYAPEDNSGAYVRLPCGLPPGTPVEGCFLLLQFCASVCPITFNGCHLSTDSCDEDTGQPVPLPSGAVDIVCQIFMGGAG